MAVIKKNVAAVLSLTEIDGLIWPIAHSSGVFINAVRELFY